MVIRKSYACFPVCINKDTVFGALSIFLGYNRNFSDIEIYFLKNIACMIASLNESYRLINELKKAHEKIGMEKDSIASSSRSAVYHEVTDEHLHAYKNDLLNLRETFREMLSAPKQKCNKLINNQIQWIEEKVIEIQKEFEGLQVVKVNLNYLISSLVKHYKLELKDTNIDILFDRIVEIPNIEVSEDQMKEVFVNLISNSIKALKTSKKKHSGKILIKTDIVRKNGIEYIQVKVEDNGIGIRKENFTKIFIQGFTTFEGGTGQGLFITKRIIKNYGGMINVNSNIGKITIFYIYIPLKRYQI